ncbi:MAG: DNA repair protein RecN [Candidatus Hydrogenedentes bacterium]|nr:DNA repair protein RecN [Candidatus Hydrogenedentota bacterium]
MDRPATGNSWHTCAVHDMLEILRIQNYALIDEIEIEFQSGLNVLTGETGAGKSILVDALNLVLGARAASETVRDGADRARVEAVFRLPRNSRRLTGLLKESGIEPEDDALIVSRTVTSDGRSRALVCGQLTPLSLLARVGDELVDLHGQHEHQSLLRPERQLDLLDGFAHCAELAADVLRIVLQLRETEKSIAELETFDRERERRIEFSRHEVNEIEAAHLQPGEEEELRSRRTLITNAERIVALTSSAYAALYEGEGAAVDRIAVALKALDELAAIDERFRPFGQPLAAFQAGLEEVATDVRRYTERAEFDPVELDRINERLSLIGNLRRKYGADIEAILAYRQKAHSEIETFEQRDVRLEELKRRRGAELSDALEKARVLSEKRKASARKLDRQITLALQELGMKGGRFEMHFETTQLSSDGNDRVEFLLTANPGEKPKALRQVASGGEVSRIMLALKAVFAEADRIPTLIFDEIDAGVGGTVATKVADKLRELARSHQTICITHIPQIAAAAQTHYRVSKTTGKGRTLTKVSRVDAEERVEELARLLDGSGSQVSLEHARALLATSVEAHRK